MEGLEKYFDHYVINARLKPTFFVVMPFAITTLAWCPEAQQLAGIVLTFLITFGVMAFLSNLVSNKGNQLQAQLYETWGGAPTTILLRHSDSTLDPHTTQRYHDWIETHVPQLILPTPHSEADDPAAADSAYISATNFLREYTRDKSKYPMVYSDNVAYGFVRNLLAMRGYGIFVSFFSIVLNGAFLYFVYEGQPIREFVAGHMSMVLFATGATVAAIILLFILIFSLNEAYVRERGLRYAKSLLAACEAD